MNVASILKVKGSDVTTIRPEISVAEAARILDENKIGAAVVTDATGAVKGILSERDIVRGTAREGASALDQPVSTLMTPLVLCCGLEDAIDDVMEMMTDRRVRHVPVMDGGKLSGIVSIGDVVKTKIEATEREAEALKAYIATG